MNSQRLKQLRQARGLSLEALAARMGGIVTKQALSKYEQGKATPSATVTNRLAAALGVKAAYLWSEPVIDVQFIAYRKGSGLLKRDQAVAESLVRERLEARVRLEDLVRPAYTAQLPVQSLPVKCLEDAERSADRLRARWDLGLDPICSMTGTLEDHSVHVIEIDASERFDGIAAIARQDGQLRAAAVVTRRGLPGERQRLDLAHELGHLVLDTVPAVDEEDAAFRFGAAFLAPAQTVRQEVGASRSMIPDRELLLLKQRYGMSMQALVRRFCDLGIISISYYREWFVSASRRHWRKSEPVPLPPERPQWLERNALHALAEGLLTRDEAESLLGRKLEGRQPLSLVERRAFLKLPLEERRRILAEQAEEAAVCYEAHPEWRELQGGDIVEYTEQGSQSG